MTEGMTVNEWKAADMRHRTTVKEGHEWHRETEGESGKVAGLMQFIVRERQLSFRVFVTAIATALGTWVAGISRLTSHLQQLPCRRLGHLWSRGSRSGRPQPRRNSRVDWTACRYIVSFFFGNFLAAANVRCNRRGRRFCLVVRVGHAGKGRRLASEGDVWRDKEAARRLLGEKMHVRWTGRW